MTKTSTLSTKHFMLTAVASLLGLSANAQYSQTVSQYPDKAYGEVTANFKLTDVAETLGTDTATLVKALQTWYDTNTAEGATPSGEAMFQVKVGDSYAPTDASGYNGNFNGLWLGKDGTLQTWGSGAIFHAGSTWDSDPDVNAFKITLCQFPDSLKGGETFTNTFALNYGGKTATFDVTYNISTPADVPEPATLIRSEFKDKMTKVGETTVKTTRTDVQGYETTTLKVDAKEIAEKLGVDLEKFKTMDVSKLVYTIGYDTDNGGVADDTLTNKATATAPGFWYRQTIYGQGEEKQGETSPILGSATYSNEDPIYIQGFKFDGDSIVCDLGQYPGVLKADDDLTAPVYIMYGDKYYLINYNVKCEAAAVANISDYENAGNLDIELEFNQFTGDYGVVYKEIDLESIMAALGITDKSAIQFKVAKDDDSFYPGNTDAGTYGYWMDSESHKTSWKDADSSPLFVTYQTSGDPSVIGVGLFAGLHQKAGNSYTSKVYYVAGTKYYTLTFKCNVVEKQQATHDTWEIVAEKTVAKQVIANSEAYIADNNQTTYSLTAAECEELIGTSSPTLYCDLADSLKVDGKLYSPYSVYACDPKPGVWLGKYGQGHLWSGSEEAPVGICWLQSDQNGMSAGDFAVYQVPNINKAGDTYKASLYLVNDDTYKMIKININISFVSEIKQAETVGTESLYVESQDGEEKPFTVDLTKAAEALGVSVEELLNDDNHYFKALTSSGTYSNSNISLSSGYTFNQDGYVDANGDGTYGIAYNGDNIWAAFLNKTPEDDTWKINTSFCFEVNDKQYVFNVTFVDSNTFTGVDNIQVESSSKNGKMYNLRGMEIKTPAKGQVYIKNGKKYIK